MGSVLTSLLLVLIVALLASQAEVQSVQQMVVRQSQVLAVKSPRRQVSQTHPYPTYHPAPAASPSSSTQGPRGVMPKPPAMPKPRAMPMPGVVTPTVTYYPTPTPHHIHAHESSSASAAVVMAASICVLAFMVVKSQNCRSASKVGVTDEFGNELADPSSNNSRLPTVLPWSMGSKKQGVLNEILLDNPVSVELPIKRALTWQETTTTAVLEYPSDDDAKSIG